MGCAGSARDGDTWAGCVAALAMIRALTPLDLRWVSWVEHTLVLGLPDVDLIPVQLGVLAADLVEQVLGTLEIAAADLHAEGQGCGDLGVGGAGGAGEGVRRHAVGGEGLRDNVGLEVALGGGEIDEDVGVLGQRWAERTPRGSLVAGGAGPGAVYFPDAGRSGYAHSLMAGHVPVLLRQVVDLLDPKPGDVVLDCTAGLGGHAAELAARAGPTGDVVLNDLDAGNLARASARVSGGVSGGGSARVATLHGNFADAPRRVEEQGLAADVVLADLGFASNQIEDAARGFSFMRDGPLDMRLDPSQGATAADLVRSLPEGELVRIIREFGEDREAFRIARKIVQARQTAPITTTGQLADIVRQALGPAAARDSIHPATRTFQGLRIAVNDELGSLEAFLHAVRHGAGRVRRGESGWLRPLARVGIISFHSLEDRIVKRGFGALVDEGLAQHVTRKPVEAEEDEVRDNPRSRSAKLRVIQIAAAG